MSPVGIDAFGRSGSTDAMEKQNDRVYFVHSIKGEDNILIRKGLIGPNPVLDMSIWGLGVLAGLLDFIGMRRRMK